MEIIQAELGMPAGYMMGQMPSLKDQMIVNYDEEKSNESFLGLQSLSDVSEIESTEQLTGGIYNDFSNFPVCTYASEDAVYKLNGLQSWDYSPQVGKGQVFYGICRDSKSKNLPKACEGKPSSQSYYVEGGVCYAFNVAGKTKTVAATMTGSQPLKGVELLYTSDEQKCPSDKSKSLTLTLNIQCDQAQTENPKSGTWNKDPCNIEHTIASKSGCPVYEYGLMSKFFEQYSMYLGALFIAVGLYLAFFGNQFVEKMIAFITSVAVFFTGLYLTNMLFGSIITKGTTPVWVGWIVLISWAIVGSLVGCWMARRKKWALAVIGCFAGLMFGSLLTTSFMVSNAIVYYLVIVACGMIAFALTLKFESHVIIVSTAFMGSYGVIRGISMYAGGFPSEQELHALASTGAMKWENFPKIFYLYLASIIVLFIGSTMFQMRRHKIDEFNKIN